MLKSGLVLTVGAYSWGPHCRKLQWVEAKRTVLAKRTNSLAFGKH